MMSENIFNEPSVSQLQAEISYLRSRNAKQAKEIAELHRLIGQKFANLCRHESTPDVATPPKLD
jgi:hypothetical protein